MENSEDLVGISKAGLKKQNKKREKREKEREELKGMITFVLKNYWKKKFHHVMHWSPSNIVVSSEHSS